MPNPLHARAIGRRRALTILAAGAAGALLPGPGGAASAARWVWRGQALGTRARIVLYHPDREQAQAAIAACVAEIARLEREFSLFRADSALARLNREGRLDAPSHDMRRLLAEALRFGALSGGAFDVSIQPLWRLMAAHYARRPAPDGGPAPEALAAARARVDYRRIDLHPDRVDLGAGMALTLNGIAQGYITDRVAEILRARGWSHLLLDLGEIRALDRRPDGRPWHVAVPDPVDPGRRLALSLDNQALATSAGSGTPFDGRGHHHLLDPATGESRNAYRSVTVRAPRATVADALSTALYLVPPPRAAALLAAAGPAEAWLTRASGRTERLRG